MKKNRMLHLHLFILAVTVLTMCAVNQPVFAKTFRLVIGSGWPVPPTSPNFGKMIKEAVESRTSHKITLVEAYGGSVAKPGEGLEAVRDGVINIGHVAWPFNPNETFLHNWGYALPFSTPDPILAFRIGRQMLEQIPYLTKVFEEKYNQKLLACGTFGGYHMITTFPVRSIDDLKNKKIAGAGPNLSWLKDIGAVPVQASVMEAYTSIQTGVYDGYIASTTLATITRIYEVAKYFTFWDLGDYLVSSFNVNSRYWRSLPSEVQQIFLETAEEYEMAAAKWLKVQSEKQISQMKKSGVQFSQAPFAEKKRWADAMQNYAQKFIKMAETKGLPGEELVKAYIAALESEGYRFPRRWVNP